MHSTLEASLFLKLLLNCCLTTIQACQCWSVCLLLSLHGPTAAGTFFIVDKGTLLMERDLMKELSVHIVNNQVLPTDSFVSLCPYLCYSPPTCLFLLSGVQETFYTVWRLIPPLHQCTKRCGGCHCPSEQWSLPSWSAYSQPPFRKCWAPSSLTCLACSTRSMMSWGWYTDARRSPESCFTVSEWCWPAAQQWQMSPAGRSWVKLCILQMAYCQMLHASKPSWTFCSNWCHYTAFLSLLALLVL